jgi:hypothetical protein
MRPRLAMENNDNTRLETRSSQNSDDAAGLFVDCGASVLVVVVCGGGIQVATGATCCEYCSAPILNDASENKQKVSIKNHRNEKPKTLDNRGRAVAEYVI